MKFNSTALLLLVISFMSSSCLPWGDKPLVYNSTGPTTEQLATAADKQAIAAKAIDVDSKKIEDKKPNAAIMKLAQGIRKSNEVNTANVIVLRSEADDKKGLMKHNSKLQTSNSRLQERLDSGFRKFTYWLYGIGALMIAAGVFLAIKLHYEFAWVSVGGVTLVIAAISGQWMQDNKGKVMIFTGAILLVFFWRLWKTQHDVGLSAIKITEKLKCALSAKRRREMFGDVISDGEAGALMNEQSKTIIDKYRQGIAKVASPTIPSNTVLPKPEALSADDIKRIANSISVSLADPKREDGSSTLYAEPQR